MDYKDYYKILGVPRSATEKDIKAAYRKLARQFHPDVNPGDKKSEQKFQEINEANEVLSNAENRQKYDQLGANWKQASSGRRGGGGPQVDFNFDDLINFGGGGQGGGGGGAGFSSFFDRFFGGGGGRGGRQAPGPAPRPPSTAPVGEVEVSLEEAFSGTTRNLELSQQTACPTCNGAGVSGSGICPRCQGAGRENSVRKLEVRIPPGVTQDAKIKAGDVYLTVKIKVHPDFELKGRDLTRRLVISLYDAVLGSELKFATPLGKSVTLKIPAESQNGKQFRLTGQGLPGASGKPPGDLYVRLEVELPTKLSPREKELFTELAQLRIS